MSLVLSSIELRELTGYKRPADQLRELKRRGFHRARRSPTTGEIILERAHYEAVSSQLAGAVASDRPLLRKHREHA